MTLSTDIERFVASAKGPIDLYPLIERCLDPVGAVGLAGLRRLAEADYATTFKYELQTPPAAALLLYGEAGLQELTELAIEDLSSRKASHAMELLASVVSGSAEAPIVTLPVDFSERLKTHLESNPSLREAARAQLRRLVLAYRDDDEVAWRVGMAMTALTTSKTKAHRALFSALAARWLAVSTPVLDGYERLIKTVPNDEPAFQAFLTSHPHLLDPLAVEIWPEPNIFGYKAPDFIIRRADNSYVVVEIECPGKALMTQAPQVTHAVTHAITQVTEYEAYLMQKYADLTSHFTGWSPPELLVVCGLERDLDEGQASVLRNYNRNQKVRIMGFDALADRARVVSANVLDGAVKVFEQLRIV